MGKIINFYDGGGALAYNVILNYLTLKANSQLRKSRKSKPSNQAPTSHMSYVECGVAVGGFM